MTMPTTTASLLEWALWYASQGHPVFPCHTPLKGKCSCGENACKNIGKHPRIKNWQNRATTSFAEIEQWWKQWPIANIGLATGQTLWVLDIDPRHGGDNELYDQEKTHGVLPETPRSKTGGGGIHFFFALSQAGVIRNAASIAPGIDVRGLGGFVIIPPSLHVSGQYYVWDAIELEETPLAEAPEWLLNQCHSRPYIAPLSADAPILSGARNETLSRTAWKMRKDNLSLKVIYAAIKEMNDNQCQPPLDEEELILIVSGKEHIQPDPVLKVSSKNRVKSQDRAWPTPTKWDVIYAETYPEKRWLVKGLIPEGLTIIGGSPKAAKSYVAHDVALATVGQGLALGHFGCEKGAVLYCAIEDDVPETKKRIFELRQQMGPSADLYFVNTTEVPSFTEGLQGYISTMVREYQLSLVVIDPLMYVYDVSTNTKDQFREIKEALLPFRQMAIELHFSLLFVDHRRKESKDDVDIFQTLYGSQGKRAIADSLIMVERYKEEVTFHCVGRSIKDQKLHFTFTRNDPTETFTWAFVGEGETYTSGSLRQKILIAFREAAERGVRKLTVKDVVDFMGMLQTTANVNNVRQAMFQMYKKGVLLRTDMGFFALDHDDDDRGVIV